MVQKTGEGSASEPFNVKSIKFDKSCVGQSVSEFDCAYGYSIGWCSGSLISNNYTGVFATLNDHSTTTVRSWTSDFISLPTLLDPKFASPVIKPKALVFRNELMSLYPKY